MSTEHRAIILKNDDPSITYVGEWTTIQADTFNHVGTEGSAFSPTLHSTKTNNSFSFSFEGSAVNVFGFENVTNFSTPSVDPTWKCLVDGVSIGPPSFSRFAENNLQLCGVEQLMDGSHELVVNVTSNGTPFYVDYLAYRSSPSVSRENSTIFIDNMDPAIDYISGWSTIGGSLDNNQTADPNSLVNVTFVGIQLMWYGFNPSQTTPHNTSSGEYIIDGQSYPSFQIPNLTPGAAAVFNQLVFTTPPLEMGSHVMSVRYTGVADQTPLTLNYLVVMNGSFPSSSTGGSNPASSTGNTKKGSSNVGAIVGGVVGAVVGLAIVIALFFVVRKLSRRRKREHPSCNIIPFDVQDRQPSVLQTSEIAKNGMVGIQVAQLAPQVEPNVPSTNVVSISAERSDSDSAISIPRLPTNRSPPRNVTVSSSQPPLPVVPVVPAVPAESTRPTTPTRLIRHEDSGIRLPRSVVREIDIPPTYTER